ncbi:hypothetical protein HDF26_001614 [Pedobacter cryoconitis]|uniref:hypothetical protein n=1 Tax=Pedobacter cryoconitis TaxID=188932 RepID=UPI0016176D7F|nr:hypothetical protein [Pedobacter cryoconitis]MBB6271187.1 hypothetical protein [Pedobacter cryoconitis]
MGKQTPMTDFFKKAVKDQRIITSHISLFSAICQCWKNSAFQHPVPITRRELMQLSKIASFATYHKCMRELNSFGYLRYEPSYRPTGSLIYWAEHGG